MAKGRPKGWKKEITTEDTRIHLVGDYYLCQDTYNWMIDRKTADGYNRISYFNNLPEACNFVLDKQLKKAGSLQEVKDLIVETRSKIVEAIKEVKCYGRLTTKGEK